MNIQKMVETAETQQLCIVLQVYGSGSNSKLDNNGHESLIQ